MKHRIYFVSWMYFAIALAFRDISIASIGGAGSNLGLWYIIIYPIHFILYMSPNYLFSDVSIVYWRFS